ncbi:MAG: cell envelope integrity protein CreD [Thermomonas sp.]|uniref:cell envelope integrity protein CreD n=1 Tax=Thermomonas sp. TaxID=1971895 RepID=UPI0039E69E00
MRLAFKVAMVVILTLAILIPLSMIRGVIHDRQQYRDQAVRDIGASYGGRQTVAGPVLVVPYEEQVEEEVTGDDGVARRVVRRKSGQWTFFPETLAMDGELKPDTRRRGLHQVRVYEWDGRVEARFDVRVPADNGTTRRSIGRPWLSFGIADVGGLQGTPDFVVNGAQARVEQGIGHADGPGVHARLPVPAAGQRLQFDTRVGMRLRGTESFSMLPLGAANDLRLRSKWISPKFDGKSPQHDIGNDGFRARWQVAAVATNAQRRFLQEPSLSPENKLSADAQEALARGMPWTPAGDSVSVSLIDPVNPYMQADRATKYGLLFVLLTFVGFFMFELIKQVRVHPIQYLLVGLAIAIFFLLLVSLSERIDFGLSYLLAALACIGLIGFYLAAVLRSAVRGLGFAAMLGTLYAALYGLLLSEDNALVLGSGLLFAILAAIMLATRKVDWYQVSARMPSPSRAESSA